jgi:hypothetical protein
MRTIVAVAVVAILVSIVAVCIITVTDNIDARTSNSLWHSLIAAAPVAAEYS